MSIEKPTPSQLQALAHLSSNVRKCRYGDVKNSDFFSQDSSGPGIVEGQNDDRKLDQSLTALVSRDPVGKEHKPNN